jgi:hypothetical protein
MDRHGYSGRVTMSDGQRQGRNLIDMDACLKLYFDILVNCFLTFRHESYQYGLGNEERYIRVE